MRLQTLQSYDGRDVPGNVNPTTQTVVATSKFSVLSKGNLRPMSKGVLETILFLDFKAQGRGRRFQYAAYGPPPPDDGHTIKEYAVRLAPATQAAVGPEGSALPPTLVPPQYGAYFCTSSMLVMFRTKVGVCEGMLAANKTTTQFGMNRANLNGKW